MEKNGVERSQKHSLVVPEGLDVQIIQKENNSEVASNSEPQEMVAAKDLLRNPKLIDIFLRDIESMGCVGDEENKLLIYLTLTSRLLQNPLSLIVKGESSSGKNHEVESVGKFFPEDQVKAFSRITPQALYYLGNEELSHKALIVYEVPGSEAAEYSIRTLQSEGELRLLTVEKNEKTGKNVREEKVVKGPVAYIETTTRINVHAENETRSFSINIDESETQTERIVEAQKRRYTEVPRTVGDSNLYEPWKIAQGLLRPYPVIIPFVDYINFPINLVRTRRDHKRFLSLIETVTMIHQHQREKKVINGAKHIVADVYDYTVAYGLAYRIIGQIFKRVSPKGEYLVKLVSENYPKENFTRKMLQDLTKWDKVTVKKYLEETRQIGYFEIAESGSQGKNYSYRLAKSVEDLPAGTLISPQEVMTKMAEKGEMGE